MANRTVTIDNLGAWVLKCDPKTWDLATYLELGHRTIDDWSVADNYRKDLMRKGQPVLFWVSGPKHGDITFRGLWGVGRLLGRAEWSPGLSAADSTKDLWLDRGKAAEPGYSVDTDITLMKDPIPADVFTSDPLLASCEIIRSQQLSNPVFLTVAEYEAVRKLVGEWISRPNQDDEEVVVGKRGAGFGSPEQNRKVEAAAMTAATKHYERSGYRVADVSHLNLGWDLTVFNPTSAGDVRRVEVKGVSGTRPRVLLTRNEAAAMWSEKSWELAVVTSALKRPQVQVFTRKATDKVITPFAWEATLG